MSRLLTVPMSVSSHSASPMPVPSLHSLPMTMPSFHQRQCQCLCPHIHHHSTSPLPIHACILVDQQQQLLWLSAWRRLRVVEIRSSWVYELCLLTVRSRRETWVVKSTGLQDKNCKTLPIFSIKRRLHRLLLFDMNIKKLIKKLQFHAVVYTWSTQVLEETSISLMPQFLPLPPAAPTSLSLLQITPAAITQFYANTN